jgi:hypothetical protein
MLISYPQFLSKSGFDAIAPADFTLDRQIEHRTVAQPALAIREGRI